MKASGLQEFFEEEAPVEPVGDSGLAGGNILVDVLVGSAVGLRGPRGEIGGDFSRLSIQGPGEPFADWEDGFSFPGQNVSGVAEGLWEEFQLQFLGEIAEVEMSSRVKSIEGLRDQIIGEEFSVAMVQAVEVIVEKFMQTVFVDPVPRDKEFVIKRSGNSAAALEVRGDLREVPPEKGSPEGGGF